MRLHRNAALSWQGRRLLVTRVLERGWTLTVAAEAAGVVGRLDGRRTLRELSAPRDAVAACRELVEVGALELRSR